ncbi:MAG: efflux RND transporter periplasmic adaptor subunit [Spirochaetales bacterium]|nr:efflux RND transporter periplasmic adaptor subunit [Spirochaetales bacterium]
MAKPKRSLKKMIIKYLILAAVLAGIFFGLRAFFSSKEIIEYDAPKPVVEVSKPEYKTMESSLILNGHVEAESMIPVVPFVNGTIVEYNARAGEYVEEDQVLAEIDPEPFEFQVTQAKAAYFGYQSTYDRVSALWDVKAVTQQEYDTVCAQRDAAKAQYELAKLQLSYATVTAPVAGTVLMAPQAVGSIGNTKQPVAVLASLDNLVVRLQVPERYFDLFSQQKMELEAFVIRESDNAPDGELIAPAIIETIAPYVEPTAKTFEVKFRLKEDLDLFRPGMYVKAKIVYQRRAGVPALPETAKKLDGSVYLYDEETTKVSWINFVPEIESDGYFSVPDEYAENFFVISGQNSLIDGQPVSVKEEE